MRSTRWLVPALSLALASSAAVASGQYYQPGPPPPQQGYDHDHDRDHDRDRDGDRGGWDQAPQEFRDAMRRGFHDGVEGARRDYENHRPPNVNNRDEFRNPKFMAPPDRHEYREGFRRGYEIAVRHIYGGNPNPYNRPY